MSRVVLMLTVINVVLLSAIAVVAYSDSCLWELKRCWVCGERIEVAE